MTKSIYEALIELSEAPSAIDVRDAAGLTTLGAQGTKMAANAAKAAKAAKFAAKVVPFAGSVSNAADVVNRVQQDDKVGAAIAGVGAIPILSIPAMGIQALRDKMRTGTFMPDPDEIKAAGIPNVLLAKFDDDTSHTYTNVKKLPSDAEINARIKQDFPDKKISNIVKGKF